MNVWKWVGLAGIVGVAALGVAAGASTMQRKRREFVDAHPDDVRLRLQERLRAAQARQTG